MKTISIVSPCFNEQDNVAQCHAAVRALFDGPLKGYRREHIFVDNASTDGTVEILRQIAEADEQTKIIVNSRNFGVFRSVFNALRYATGDAVLVLLPVDLQDPPELLPDFVRLWEEGYEIVAGARTNREEGFVMRNMRHAFYRAVNLLSDFEITPDVGEFQLIDRRVLDALLQQQDRYPYIRGLIASLGFRRIVVPYTWKARKRGKSKFRFMALADTALNGIFSFTRAPMRMCTIAGAVIALASIAFSIFSVIAYFVVPGTAPRGVTTIITALFFLSGVQLIFIGILGEYITAIHNQVRGGPMVIERERINVGPTKGAASADGTAQLSDLTPRMRPMATNESTATSGKSSA